MITARSTRIGPFFRRATHSPLSALLCAAVLNLWGVSCSSTTPHSKAAQKSAPSMSSSEKQDWAGVTSVYSTRSPRSEADGLRKTPDPIEIPPPDVLMITDRADIGKVEVSGQVGPDNPATLKAKVTFSLLTIHRCDVSLPWKDEDPAKVVLEWWDEGEWVLAGTSTIDDTMKKALKVDMRTSTKGGTGSGSHTQQLTFKLVDPTDRDYTKVPLRFTLEAKMVFNGKEPTLVTCSVAFPSQQ